MAKITANGIQIEYDTFGKPGEPPLLLIEGLACQLIHWDEALREQSARRGPLCDPTHGGAWTQMVVAIVNHTQKIST